jgi:hypothetical protein
VQWDLKLPCVQGLTRNTNSLSWQRSAWSQPSQWSQLASCVVSSWLVTTIHGRLQSQTTRFTNTETLVYLNCNSTCTKMSPWRGSSSCGQGRIQSRAQTGVHPTGAWSTSLLAVTQGAYLQQNLFIMPCCTLKESVLPTLMSLVRPHAQCLSISNTYTCSAGLTPHSLSQYYQHTHSPTSVLVGFGGACRASLRPSSSCDTKPAKTITSYHTVRW